MQRIVVLGFVCAWASLVTMGAAFADVPGRGPRPRPPIVPPPPVNPQPIAGHVTNLDIVLDPQAKEPRLYLPVPRQQLAPVPGARPGVPQQPGVNPGAAPGVRPIHFEDATPIDADVNDADQNVVQGSNPQRPTSHWILAGVALSLAVAFGGLQLVKKGRKGQWMALGIVTAGSILSAAAVAWADIAPRPGGLPLPGRPPIVNPRPTPQPLPGVQPGQAFRNLSNGRVLVDHSQTDTVILVLDPETLAKLRK